MIFQSALTRAVNSSSKLIFRPFIRIAQHRTMASQQNPLKVALRRKIQENVGKLTIDEIALQSKSITSKILALPEYQAAERISIYLSTSTEANTLDILKDIFRLNKNAYVPTYHGSNMEMVKLDSWQDYENLPLTKWNIKQPNYSDNRENALSTGGLDLIIMPGVAFTRENGRCGHGRGYYDKFLERLFEKYPKNNRKMLLALGLKEQIVDVSELPLNDHDYIVDAVVTSD